MQFFQLTTIVALAASATAAAVPVEARTVATDAFNGGLQLCRETSGACHFGGVEDCSSKGWGEPYNCQTFGLVNVLQCFSVLNGNTVNVNILDAFY